MTTTSYCVVGAHELFFSFNQGSWKNCKELKSCWADTCADMAERPAGPLVALWAWLPTWLCPSAHSGLHQCKGRSGKRLPLQRWSLFIAHQCGPVWWCPVNHFGRICVQTLALPLASYVISHKSVNVSRSQLLHLWSGIPELRTVMYFA